jgi:hypothetical protein
MGGETEPFGGFFIVLRDSFAAKIEHSKKKSRVCIFLIGGAAKPIDGLGIVLRFVATEGIFHTQRCFGLSVSLGGFCRYGLGWLRAGVAGDAQPEASD